MRPRAVRATGIAAVAAGALLRARRNNLLEAESCAGERTLAVDRG
jgi:hypothetical protein